MSVCMGVVVPLDSLSTQRLQQEEPRLKANLQYVIHVYPVSTDSFRSDVCFVLFLHFILCVWVLCLHVCLYLGRPIKEIGC